MSNSTSEMVSEWIDRQVSDRRLHPNDKAFLSHIILDMPAVQYHIKKAAAVLYINGTLMAFNPSIIQIMAVVELVKRQYLPLQLDRVIELGPSMTGGRDWDVRSMVPRAPDTIRGKDESNAVDETDDGTTEERDEDVPAREALSLRKGTVKRLKLLRGSKLAREWCVVRK